MRLQACANSTDAGRLRNSTERGGSAVDSSPVYCTGRRLTDGEYGVMKGNWERRRAGLVYRLGIAVQGPAKLKAARVDRSAAEPLSRER